MKIAVFFVALMLIAPLGLAYGYEGAGDAGKETGDQYRSTYQDQSGEDNQGTAVQNNARERVSMGEKVSNFVHSLFGRDTAPDGAPEDPQEFAQAQKESGGKVSGFVSNLLCNMGIKSKCK